MAWGVESTSVRPTPPVYSAVLRLNDSRVFTHEPDDEIGVQRLLGRDAHCALGPCRLRRGLRSLSVGVHDGAKFVAVDGLFFDQRLRDRGRGRERRAETISRARS